MDRFLAAAAVLLAAVCMSACQARGEPALEDRPTSPAPPPSIEARRELVVPIGSGDDASARVIAGHRVEIVQTTSGHGIRVDGRALAKDTDDDRVVLQGIYRGAGRTYALISEQSGGNACPSLYQAIDLSAAAAAAISPQFGSCSDIPRVSVIAGALTISVPASVRDQPLPTGSGTGV